MASNSNLKNLFTNNPTLQKVWVNEGGEWVFAPLEGFNELSREDVLELPEEATEEVAQEATTEEATEETPKPKKPSKK